MPAPTALLRRPEELVEAESIPLPPEGPEYLLSEPLMAALTSD